MKLPHSLLILLVFVVSLCTAKASIPLEIQGNEPEKIEINFNDKLEFNDLVKIKLDLSDKGIVLNYQKLEFDDNGMLIAIDFKVDCRDGFSGGAIWNQLSDNEPFGFYRDYAKGSPSPFGTGGLK